MPSDSTLAHSSVSNINVHLNYAEPDCTGNTPLVWFGVLSYQTGTYTEKPATMNDYGCNFTFNGNSGTQLSDWWNYSSWYPMVRVAAGTGEPIYIRGIYMSG